MNMIQPIPWILYKKRAPSAHMSRFGSCTNGVQLYRVAGAKLYRGVIAGDPLPATAPIE
jgi:hypothetical protein